MYNYAQKSTSRCSRPQLFDQQLDSVNLLRGQLSKTKKSVKDMTLTPKK